jgi:hypothetical protein
MAIRAIHRHSTFVRSNTCQLSFQWAGDEGRTVKGIQGILSKSFQVSREGSSMKLKTIYRKKLNLLWKKL